MAQKFKVNTIVLNSQRLTTTGTNLYINENELALSTNLVQTGSDLNNRISNWGVKSASVSGTQYSGNIGLTGLGSVTVDVNSNTVRISGIVVDSSTFLQISQTGEFYPRIGNPSGFVTGQVVRPSDTGQFYFTGNEQRIRTIAPSGSGFTFINFNSNFNSVPLIWPSIETSGEVGYFVNISGLVTTSGYMALFSDIIRETGVFVHTLVKVI